MVRATLSCSEQFPHQTRFSVDTKLWFPPGADEQKRAGREECWLGERVGGGLGGCY